MSGLIVFMERAFAPLANVWRHMPAGDSDSGNPGNSDQAGA